MIFKVGDPNAEGDPNTSTLTTALKIKLKYVKLINGVWTAGNNQNGQDFT